MYSPRQTVELLTVKKKLPRFEDAGLFDRFSCNAKSKSADEADKGHFSCFISQDFVEFWNDLDEWYGCFGLGGGLNLNMRLQVLSAAVQPKGARAW